uniref:Uncharacterized protein n=1 Tax=Chromera velia CCMP2878 TaxID=1169474 RepID=A0A0G4FE73_9ALVE|eukprot:Cvel_16558.t1-p1 / transcript=Cvel_16558.t1 / gene=Cvel_16558 / organism=Chromera_velia_CCMP2878 / gene_product=hypothetical protein / transcript_product=hypothetical protein / location=Cvel_scaffold1281:3848-5715(-) / protein_length=485 / sequence_SO=supercontig / SO=protein_coding / is_pseudo=false
MPDSQLTAFSNALAGERAPALQELEIVPRTGHAVGVERFASAVSSEHLFELRALKFQIDADSSPQSVLLRARSQTSRITLARSLGGGHTRCLRSLDLQKLLVVSDGTLMALAEGIQGGGLSSLENCYLVFDKFRGLNLTRTPAYMSRLVHQSGHMNAYAVSAFGAALRGGGCPSLSNLRLGWWEKESGGVAGFAEGLDAGGLGSLRNLTLCVECGEGDSEGGRRFGEVLSTGRVLSLRNVKLNLRRYEIFGTVCEGFSGGSIAPPVLLDVVLGGEGWSTERTVTAFSDVVRGGKLSGLRRLELNGGELLSETGREALGEAFSDAHAHLDFLEEVVHSGALCRIESLVVEGLMDLDEIRLLVLGLGGGQLQSLNSLKLENMALGTLGNDGWKVLSEVLIAEKLPCLQSLGLSSVSMTNDRFRTLAEAWGSRQPAPLVSIFCTDAALSSSAGEALWSLFRPGRMPYLFAAKFGHNALPSALLDFNDD